MFFYLLPYVINSIKGSTPNSQGSMHTNITFTAVVCCMRSEPFMALGVVTQTGHWPATLQDVYQNTCHLRPLSYTEKTGLVNTLPKYSDL